MFLIKKTQAKGKPLLKPLFKLVGTKFGNVVDCDLEFVKDDNYTYPELTISTILNRTTLTKSKGSNIDNLMKTLETTFPGMKTAKQQSGILHGPGDLSNISMGYPKDKKSKFSLLSFQFDVEEENPDFIEFVEVLKDDFQEVESQSPVYEGLGRHRSFNFIIH